MDLKSLRQSDFFRLRPEVQMAAWLCIGLAVIVILDQSQYWREREDYSFGFLVPVFVGYVLYDRWPLLKAILLGKSDAGGAPTTESSFAGLLNFIAGLIVAGSLGLFLIGGFLRAVTGQDNDSALALALGLAGFVLAMGFLISRTDAQGRAVTLSARWRVVCLLMFPALAWLISAPMLLMFESRVKPILLEYVMRIVSGFFSEVLNLEVKRAGSVLILPDVIPGKPNTVGVEDACSGIRSLTACIFAGSFLAAVFLDRFWKKISLLFLAAVLAFVMNICRQLFLTSWAYNYGSEALDADFWLNSKHLIDATGRYTKDSAGNFLPNPDFHFITVHDFAGFTALIFTLAGLLLLLPLLNFKFELDDEPPTSDKAAANLTPETKS